MIVGVAILGVLTIAKNGSIKKSYLTGSSHSSGDQPLGYLQLDSV
jgi:hypothetical protein